MNREIKFRGRDIHGVWHYGYLFQGETEDNGKYSVILKQKRYQCDDNLTEDCPFAFYKDEIFVVDPKTVGQFTGLYDKKGKEIYEGDILFCVGKRYDNKGEKYYREVKFKDGFFGMMVKEYNILSLLQLHFDYDKKILCEVIGNIYDNPELLSGNKK